MEKLESAISVEQIFSRCLAAVLIQREILRTDDPPQALRDIQEKMHLAIDGYGLDRPTPPELLNQDKEMARMIVDSVTGIVGVLCLAQK